MMSFYTGNDARIYQERFDTIRKFFVLHEKVEDSNAAVFRHMVDKIYNWVIKKEGE